MDSPVTEEKRTEMVRADILSKEQKEEYPNMSALGNGFENCLVSTPVVSSTV